MWNSSSHSQCMSDTLLLHLVTIERIFPDNGLVAPCCEQNPGKVWARTCGTNSPSRSEGLRFIYSAKFPSTIVTESETNTFLHGSDLFVLLSSCALVKACTCRDCCCMRCWVVCWDNCKNGKLSFIAGRSPSSSMCRFSGTRSTTLSLFWWRNFVSRDTKSWGSDFNLDWQPSHHTFMSFSNSDYMIGFWTVTAATSGHVTYVSKQHQHMIAWPSVLGCGLNTAFVQGIHSSRLWSEHSLCTRHTQF